MARAGGAGGGASSISHSEAGVTTDAYVEIFEDVAAGLLGIGTIKNVGANPMTVRETVTDAFGVTDATTETVVAAGGSYMLDLETNFGAARPPYVSYKVEVKSTNIGNATSYTLRSEAQGED